MNEVEKVKALCKERKIPLARIEKELGFANGYISGLKKGTFPSNRLMLIADYLNVPVEELTSDQLNYGIVKPVQAIGSPESGQLYYLDEKSAALAEKLFSDPSLRALMSAAENVAPENIELAAEMLRRFKSTNPDG